MLWSNDRAGMFCVTRKAPVVIAGSSAVNLAPVLAGAVATIIVLGGCAEARVLPPELDVRSIAAHTTVSCLGFPSNWHCDQIWFAMEELELNENAVCNQMVEVLSGAVIIWEEDLEDAYAYVPYYYVPEIHIGPLAFGGSELANTLAHEASHILGWTHPEADDVGDLCAGAI